MTGKIEKQGVANLVFIYLGIGFGLINTVLRTRVLTSEQIGLIGILISISAAAGFIISFGMPSGILKYYGRFRQSPAQKTFFILLCLAFVAALTTVVGGVFTAMERFVVSQYDNALLDRYIRYVYILFFFDGVNNIISTVLLAEHRTVFVSFTLNFIDRVLFLLFLAVMMLLPELVFTHYFWFFLGTYALKTGMLGVFLSAKVELARPALAAFDRPLAKELVTYNAFMLLSGLSGVLTATVDKLMIGYMVSLEAVGVYTIVLTFPLLLRMIGAGFGAIAQPVISDCFHSGDNDEIRRIYGSNNDIQMFLGGAFLAVFVAFGEPGLAFLGEEYAGGYWVMIFLSIGEYINLGTGMCGTIISFSRSFRFDLYLRVLLLVLAVLTNYLLIPILGIDGAAIATATSLGLYNIAKVVFVWRKFGMQPYSARTIGVLVYPLVSGASLWGLERWLGIRAFGILAAVSVAFVAAYVVFGAFALRMTPAVELVETVRQILAGLRRRR